MLTVAYPLMLVGVPLGDYAHLALFYPYYREKIAQTSERPVWFPWGDRAVMVTDGVQLITLLYDDTGKSAAMIDREELFEGLWYTKQHLMGNFFLQLAISCQQLRKGCTKTQ